MGVYGNQALNEAVFFLPPEGKKFKKEVNEKLKEIRKPVFNKGMLSKKAYNQADITEVRNFLKIKYKKFMMSPMITVTRVVNNGQGTTVVYHEYYKGTFGTLDNGYIFFKCFFSHRGANATSFKYIEKSKCIVPQDVIEKAIELCDNKIELALTNNKITLNNHTIGGKKLKSDIYEKLSDYALSKYSNTFDIKKSITGGLSFKKK